MVYAWVFRMTDRAIYAPRPSAFTASPFFAELTAVSNFSFLYGAAHPHEMVAQAAALGYQAIGLADVNTMAGQVRAHMAARNLGIRFLPATRLRSACGLELIAYPHDRQSYGALCETLSVGNLKAQKGDCVLTRADMLSLARRAACEWIWVPPIVLRDEAAWPEFLSALAQAAPTHIYALLAPYYHASDDHHWQQIMALAEPLGIKPLAGANPLYHHPERRPLQDVVSCIRLGLKIDQAGYHLQANAERHLKPLHVLADLYRKWPQALAHTKNIVDACDFSLDMLAYQYPDDSFDPDLTPQELLAQRTYAGAHRRFPTGLPEKLSALLDYELALVAKLNYAPYFLTVDDIVQFARQRHILCQGRGSAANSAICYCLGITSVDPSRLDLLFERFISAERNEPPDIDVDFEHERREEVIQYIYERYGRARAAIAATVITYRRRSAIRDVAKVMGLSADIASAMLSLSWGGGGTPPPDEHIREVGIDPDQPLVRMVLNLSAQIIGFPRHLSQHVGGFVITRDALDTLVPRLNAAMAERTFIEWDKDDLDALGILKVDILALGMLSAIRRSFDLLAAHYDRHLDLSSVPAEDEAVYNMLCRAESVGVFQVESRAQMNMLPRLKPRDFYDLVIQVAIVRPGPIQGNMVHPYLRRRAGEERVDYPSPELQAVLDKTLGVPLFQEQAMRIAVVGAGFTASEADQLRRAMASFRKTGVIDQFSERFMHGMQARGYSPEFAENCFRQIEGFGEYGFPESHAASFALLVYVSAWLKCHYPDVFTAALLNSQPMGFYAPAQLVREAQRQHVTVLPVCVNRSCVEADLERDAAGQRGLRLGFNQISGLSRDACEALIHARAMAPFDSVRDCARRSGVGLGVLEKIARADGFSQLGLNRRQALWSVRALRSEHHKDILPLFAAAQTDPCPDDDADSDLPPLSLGQEVVEDYATLRLSLKAHPMTLLRGHAPFRPLRTLSSLARLPNGRRVTLAGLVICRQRPGSARGVVFLTLEDADGQANIIVWPDRFEKYRPAIIAGRLLVITGHVQRAGMVTHVIADHIDDQSGALHRLLTRSGDASVQPERRYSDARALEEKKSDTRISLEQILPEQVLPEQSPEAPPERAKSGTGRRTPREMPWRGR